MRVGFESKKTETLPFAPSLLRSGERQKHRVYRPNIICVFIYSMCIRFVCCVTNNSPRIHPRVEPL
uniref:Uncharacterized protein n=1 Tax=Anguilla anguilla TaxID=7936 RepID=A0A0E9SXQ2_ANGAN